MVTIMVWTPVCLTGYSDYLTGFREPLSTSYIRHAGLKLSIVITGRVFICL